ncbi:MAG: ABC transporter substrate-binding protein [Myxococcales bacterium]|nr:ABC transporter substrate-binding protein [Myxococcales bacterium]
MRRRFDLLTVLGLLFCLAACASAAVPPPPPPAAGGDEAAALYEKAEAYYRNNFQGKALQHYVIVIERYPNSAPAPACLFKAARLYQEKNSPDKAVYYYEMLVSRFPDNPYAVEAHYEMGVCRQQLRQYESAVTALNYYLSINNTKHADQAHLALADCYEALQRYADALPQYAAGAKNLDRAAQVEILKDVRILIDEHLGGPDLLTLLPRMADGTVVDFTRYRAAQYLVKENRRADAAKLLRQINFAKPQYKFYEKAEQLLQTAEAPAPRTAEAAPPAAREAAKPLAPAPSEIKAAIGVLLPLSGDRAVFGREVLHGLMQGSELFGAGQGAAFRIVIRDTQGDPAVAAKLVNELADDPGVLAIVGPLLSSCAKSAAIEAEKRGITLITLTTRENILDHGFFVFRNFLTASEQVKALIRYATMNQGAFRFAVLYPDNTRGRLYRDLFSQNLDSTRYRLVASVGYNPNETDFRGAVQQLNAHGQIHALFIPDNSRQVALLAPQLVYYGLKDVMLLGINSWNTDELARKAGSYLSRSVFVDGFFAHSTANGEVAPFVQQYQDSFHQPPSFLAAIGYDTAHLVARALGGHGELDREGFRRELLKVHDLSGVTGEMTVGEDREIQRHLYLLRVGGERIEELF